MDINIKCYYKALEELCPHNFYPLSMLNTSLVWEYLISETNFLNFFKRNIDEVDTIIKDTGQNLQLIEVKVLYYKEVFDVMVIFYSKEGGQKEISSFQVDSSLLNQSSNTMVKGLAAKKAIQEEIDKFTIRVARISLLLFGLVIFQLYLGINSLPNWDFFLAFPLLITLVAELVFFRLIFKYIIHFLLPRNVIFTSAELI